MGITAWSPTPDRERLGQAASGPGRPAASGYPGCARPCCIVSIAEIQLI